MIFIFIINILFCNIMNFFMKMYALFMIDGVNLVCRVFKTDTVTRYLGDSTDLCKSMHLISSFVNTFVFSEPI